jgi:2-polyprenyl-3-methyl-5-hydroxy-6-metoxy-1,4-benzoquinol methylase
MFEEIYIATRRKESRIYSDDEVRILPEISARHRHHNEWGIRRQSAIRLIQYLQARNKPLKILEVGCGNGWLSNRMSQLSSSEVIGIDINSLEIEQAERLFTADNLHFFRGDIRDGVLGNGTFDVIVFAASLQYFPSLKEIIDTCLLHLRAQGEIHIIDTNLYKESELADARQRSFAYYQSIECSEMADHYFHHTMSELSEFNFQKLGKLPILGLFKGNAKSPFPWICVSHLTHKIES